MNRLPVDPVPEDVLQVLFIMTNLAHLPTEVWSELVRYLPTEETLNLVLIGNRAVFAHLCDPLCFPILFIQPEKCTLNGLGPYFMLLDSLVRLEKLRFKFLFGGSDVPYSVDFQLLKRIGELQGKNLREFMIEDSVNFREEERQRGLTAGELFPVLFKLATPKNSLFYDHWSSMKRFLSILPPSLTSLSGSFGIELLSSLPPSLKKIHIVVINSITSISFHDAFGPLSALPNLAVIRIHGASLLQDSHPKHQIAKLYPFPNLEELAYGPHKGEDPLSLIEAPRLHSYSSNIFNSAVSLPTSLVRLKLVLNGSRAIKAAMMQALPPNLRTLHISCVGDTQTNDRPTSWLHGLPNGLEELIVPRSLIDWLCLPPRLERLICTDYDTSVIIKPFSKVARRYSKGEPTSEVRLTMPLPLTLVEIHTAVQLHPFNLLPPSLRSLSMNLARPLTLEDLQRLIAVCPSLQHLRLDGSHIVLSNTTEYGLTSFDLLSYPQQVLESRFPALLRLRLNCTWSLPAQGFILPSTLNTLVLHSLLDGARITTASIVESERITKLLRENLLRLPNLTRLEVHASHAVPLNEYISALPHLQILKNRHTIPFEFATLPRSLETLDLELVPGIQVHKASLSGPRPLLGSCTTNAPHRSQASSRSGAPRLVRHDAVFRAYSMSAYKDLDCLPSTLTNINFGPDQRFRNDTIDVWPKTLRTLSFAPDAPWSDLEALKLKSVLPHLQKLHFLRHGITASANLCFGPMPSHNIALESAATAITLEALKTAPTFVDVQLLRKLCTLHLSLFDIIVDYVIVDISSFNHLPAGITSVDLSNAATVDDSKSPAVLPEWSPNILHFRCPLLRDDDRLQFSDLNKIGDKETLDQTFVLKLPLHLTDLDLAVFSGPMAKKLLSRLPVTLKYLKIAPWTTQTWECPAPRGTLLRLPAPLEVLHLNYMTFKPSDMHVLPSRLQQLTFKGDSQWTEIDVALLAERLSLAYTTSPSAVFTDPRRKNYLIGYSDDIPLRSENDQVNDWHPIASPQFAHLNGESPRIIFLRCTLGAFSGHFKHSSSLDASKMSSLIAHSLWSKGAYVEFWHQSMRDLQVQQPESLLHLQLARTTMHDTSSPVRIALWFDTIAALHQLPQMTSLQSISIRVTCSMLWLFESLPSSLQHLHVSGPHLICRSPPWSSLPRGLLSLSLVERVTAKCEVALTADLPPNLEAFHCSEMTFPVASLCALPSGLRYIAITASPSDIQAEWQRRGLSIENLSIEDPRVIDRSSFPWWPQTN